MESCSIIDFGFFDGSRQNPATAFDGLPNNNVWNDLD
jgi:hypothetical protein